MGAKLIYRNESSFSHWDEQDNVDLQGWRAAKEVKSYYTHDGNKSSGLLVVLKLFRCYFIPNYTINMLHHANKYDFILDIPYEYVKNFLSCLTCNAIGKVDWVEQAIGEKEYKGMNYYDPQYNPSKYIKVDASNESSYYIGIACLNKGDNICKECNGTGIHKKSMLWFLNKN